MSLAVGVTRLDVPAHEDEWDVSVSRSPCAVRRTVEVLANGPLEVVDARHEDDIARATMIIAVDNTLEIGRASCRERV